MDRSNRLARRCPSFDRYRLFGRVGFVSDDTEQSALVDHLQEGPFGGTHLRALADVLTGKRARATYAWPVALLRNVALLPVVLIHGLRVLFA